ncbi:MAG: phosphoribosylformylglycinamidine synthase [Phycisphaerales bacterium]|nr:phosphoribosylformylglycinamidine synthase [Phycisphaerales bacterium]
MVVGETTWRIEVTATRAEDDARGRAMSHAARQAGFTSITAIRATRIYKLRGHLSAAAADVLAAQLFTDPVIETYVCTQHANWPDDDTVCIEVHLQPGVMDPVAQSALGAAAELLASRAASEADHIAEIRTGWRYHVAGIAKRHLAKELAQQVLANTCMESIYLRTGDHRDDLPQRFPEPPVFPFEKRTIAILGLDDDALAEVSRAGRLFLNVTEMRAIRDHFAALGRDPSDVELETIAQTWSEHCVHKTLKSAVTYRGKGFGAKRDRDVEVQYANLLKDTVMRATRELNKPWCLSVFADNAGIIDAGNDYGVAFKVETHNHPSAIEPYGGSATGVGGCIRDILGCGLGARPVANTDVFCVANPEMANDRVPVGVLHPQRILRGVVAGVRDYGNRMGIPTVAGGLFFDDRYLGNPLVFCGCVGVIPKERIAKAPCKGDRIVVAGGRTGRDGIGGATFSSGELTDAHADEFAHAVQIGNAIEEKKVLDAQLRARDHEGGCLYSCVTDCGAGGLSSAVGEMAEELGAVVDLDRVPLKYSGLRYNEIWLSEAQERMVFAVSPEKLDTLLVVFAEEEVEATDIGVFTGDGRIQLHYAGNEVALLDCDFLHNGVPMPTRAATWTTPRNDDLESESIPVYPNAEFELPHLLADLNICARDAITRQYDQEVQGGSVIKPAVGRGEGPSDAAVVAPHEIAPAVVALGKGMCPRVSDRDPYEMAIRAIDEALRNVICVGAHPERIALLDNFCWGGVGGENEMGSLVRACQGCYDAAIAYGTPFISGKDSLNNQFSLSPDDAERLGLPRRIAIPHTLLISALGMIDDATRCVTSDLKRSGNTLAVVLGDKGSSFDDLASRAVLHNVVANLVGSGAVAACHDISDGGLAVTLAEMCIGGKLGANVRCDVPLFDDMLAGYVLELHDADALSSLTGVDVRTMGTVTDDARFVIHGEGRNSLDVPVAELERAWRRQCGIDMESA